MNENELDTSLQMSNTVRMNHRAVSENAVKVAQTADMQRERMLSTAGTDDAKLAKMKKIIADKEAEKKAEVLANEEKPLLTSDAPKEQWYFVSFTTTKDLHRVTTGYFVYTQNKLDAVKNIMEMCAKMKLSTSDYNAVDLTPILLDQRLAIRSVGKKDP